MKVGNFSKEPLKSTAYLSKIRIFIPRRVDYEEDTVAVFSPYRFQDPYAFEGIKEDGIIRNFPMLFRGDGTPWDTGNLYLMYKMAERAKFNEVSVDTLDTHAGHLLSFLRWLEHNQNEGNNINEFTFPEAAHERVTYGYRRYLMRLIRKTPPPISVGVAKTRIGIVVNFYRALLKGHLIDSSKLPNPPYEESIAGIPYVNRVGLQRIKEVLTTDLTIRVPNREINSDTNYLNDGGNLRPLESKEQDLIRSELENYGNRAFELILIFAMTTGARKQTVCTLKIHHIKNLLQKSQRDELKLKVGAGTDVDVKSRSDHKHFLLHIPRSMAVSLLDYADSEEARERRQKSFYGDSDNNYIFLSKTGNPYYTSKAELRDRENPDFSSRIARIDRIDFSVTKGRALNNLIQRLIERIRRKQPNFEGFRFHDTRATYGMNYLRGRLADGDSSAKILQDLSARLGHANVKTTLGYLDFDINKEREDNNEDQYAIWLNMTHRPDLHE